jgi:hypothetical protein
MKILVTLNEDGPPAIQKYKCHNKLINFQNQIIITKQIDMRKCSSVSFCSDYEILDVKNLFKDVFGIAV